MTTVERVLNDMPVSDMELRTTHSPLTINLLLIRVPYLIEAVRIRSKLS